MTSEESRVITDLKEELQKLTGELRDIKILLGGGPFGQKGLVLQFEDAYTRIGKLEDRLDAAQPAINIVNTMRGKALYGVIGVVTIWLFSGGDTSVIWQIVSGVFR